MKRVRFYRGRAMAHSLANGNLRQLVGSLRSASAAGAVTQAVLPTWPFVTISRQAGVGGMKVGQLLADALNQRDRPDHPWQCLDRELVERIAADHHLSTELIDSLERASHTWIAEYLGGLSIADRGTPSELAVFRRVVETMRGLARAGHVVLVGLGGAFITRDMAGGIHARIAASFNWRADRMARQEQITRIQARQHVKLRDRDREAFFNRFWPGHPLNYEMFHITFNAGRVTEEQMAASLMHLIKPS